MCLQLSPRVSFGESRHNGIWAFFSSVSCCCCIYIYMYIYCFFCHVCRQHIRWCRTDCSSMFTAASWSLCWDLPYIRSALVLAVTLPLLCTRSRLTTKGVSVCGSTVDFFLKMSCFSKHQQHVASNCCCFKFLIIPIPGITKCIFKSNLLVPIAIFIYLFVYLFTVWFTHTLSRLL